MEDSGIFGILLLGFTIVILFSILKDAALKSAQKMCPLTRPAPPAEPPKPMAPAPPASAPQPLAAPVPLPQAPAPISMPMLAPQPAYQPPPVYSAPFPGGNGRSVDPAKVAQVIAIMEEMERRRQWQPNTNY